MMTTARKYIVAAHFQGTPKRSDFKIAEEKLPALNDGEFLAEAVWLSVDPYVSAYSRSTSCDIGDTVIGSQVAKATAYFGFLELCSPKEGETLVVNGTAGAIGSAVGQIAKIKGCRVVGFTGSDEKVGYLKGLGFDEAYNYKTITSLKETLKIACPKGIDMFFDNVGGDFYDTVLPLMNEFGRVSVCGCISQYNLVQQDKGIRVNRAILFKQLRVEGFIVMRWLAKWPEAFKQLNEWIEKGQLKYSEDVMEGFDNMFDAFAGLFTGKNLGKAVVKA